MASGIILVGCGNMGEALLAGWLEQGVAAEAVCVIEPDPSRASQVRERYGVRCLADPSGLQDGAAPDAVVLAVKPQMLDAIAPAYSRFAAADTVVLSIAAGRTLSSLAELLGDHAIVRAMPNTPAAVRAGITVACANAMVSDAQRAAVDTLLAAVGAVDWVDDETLIDAVTAVSGSGPAYVFLLAECLADAGIAAGLPPDLSRRLARQTVIGAAQLLAQASDDPAVLRRKVTSPGGTTEAALAILRDEPGLASLLTAAVRAAAARSRQLAQASVSG